MLSDYIQFFGLPMLIGIMLCSIGRYESILLVITKLLDNFVLCLLNTNTKGRSYWKYRKIKAMKARMTGLPNPHR